MLSVRNYDNTFQNLIAPLLKEALKSHSLTCQGRWHDKVVTVGFALPLKKCSYKRLPKSILTDNDYPSTTQAWFPSLIKGGVRILITVLLDNKYNLVYIDFTKYFGAR